MADGHPDLVIPQSTSELHRMVNNLRAHHRAMHGQVSDVAAALKTILPDVIKARGGTNGMLLGADARYQTARIIKPFTDIAALDDVIARLYVQGYTRYVEYVVNARAAKPKNTFNVNG